jgi:hypothetical protein
MVLLGKSEVQSIFRLHLFFYLKLILTLSFGARDISPGGEVKLLQHGSHFRCSI